MGERNPPGKKGATIKSKYVLLAEIINDVLSFMIGPSKVNFDDIKPNVASPLNSF